MANLPALLARPGRVVAPTWRKTTVFLRHMRDYPLMNEIYAERVPRALPGPLGGGGQRAARSVALVEIEAWAWTGA